MEKLLKTYGIVVHDDGTIIGRSGNPVMGEIFKGYRRVGVSYYENNKRIRKHKFVHRLIAEAFLHDYSENLVVNHKDGDKLNNILTNIEMCTVKYNTHHAFTNGLCDSLIGENTHLNKYSETYVRKIYEELEHVERYPNGNIKAGELIKIADKLGTTRFVIKNYSRNRKIWKHLFSSATTIPEEEVGSSDPKRQPSENSDDDIV